MRGNAALPFSAIPVAIPAMVYLLPVAHGVGVCLGHATRNAASGIAESQNRDLWRGVNKSFGHGDSLTISRRSTPSLMGADSPCQNPTSDSFSYGVDSIV